MTGLNRIRDVFQPLTDNIKLGGDLQSGDWRLHTWIKQHFRLIPGNSSQSVLFLNLVQITAQMSGLEITDHTAGLESLRWD